VRLAARALVGAGHEGLDRVATLGVRRDAAVAVRACAVVARGKFPGGVGLPGLEEGIVDWRAGAVEHLPGERDALAPAGEQHDAAIFPQELAREERADRLRGRGLGHD